MGVGEELSYDAGFCDDVAVVGDGGDEAPGVNAEVFGGAGHGEVDNFFFVGELELGKGDVGAVGPRAEVVSVEDDFGIDAVGIAAAVCLAVCRHFEDTQSSKIEYS